MPLVNSLPPSLSEKAVREFTEELFGLKVSSVRPLVGDIGQNFYLADEAEMEYIFKIAHPSERREVLEAQNQVMDHLGENETTFRYPKAYHALSGEQIVSITAKDGTTYAARLLTYLPGVFLAEVQPHSSQLLYSLGALLGTMDRALADFYHPATERYWKWDLKHACDLNRYTEYITNARRRTLAEYFLLQFETYVLPHLPALRNGVIHNDANDHNVLIRKTGAGITEVSGLIDFGDLAHTCTIFELAVGLAYVMLGKTDLIAAAVPVFRGYHQAFPITEQELEVLFYSICVRLSSSVIISAYQQHLRPDDPYLSISEQPAWEMLARMLTVNPLRAYQEFRQACGGENELAFK